MATKVNTKAATLFEMADYLLSKMNIGASLLDANAIACMNRLFIELRKDKRKFNVSDGKEAA